MVGTLVRLCLVVRWWRHRVVHAAGAALLLLAVLPMGNLHRSAPPVPPPLYRLPVPPAGVQIHRHPAAAHLQHDPAGHEPPAPGAHTQAAAHAAGAHPQPGAAHHFHQRLPRWVGAGGGGWVIGWMPPICLPGGCLGGRVAVGALLGWPASTDLQRCPVALQALPSLHAALPCPTPHSPEQLPVIPAAILS